MQHLTPFRSGVILLSTPSKFRTWWYFIIKTRILGENTAGLSVADDQLWSVNISLACVGLKWRNIPYLTPHSINTFQRARTHTHTPTRAGKQRPCVPLPRYKNINKDAKRVERSKPVTSLSKRWRSWWQVERVGPKHGEPCPLWCGPLLRQTLESIGLLT